ncbi:MAG: DoxX family protein [Acidobacteriota bacterium]
MAHGRTKLLGLGNTEGFLANLGFPLPGVFAVILAVVEFVGGIFLVAGFFISGPDRCLSAICVSLLPGAAQTSRNLSCGPSEIAPPMSCEPLS